MEIPAHPPCWFGLTPGVSTAADVEALFAARPEMFTGENSFLYEPLAHGDVDPVTGYLLEGEYRFGLVGSGRSDLESSGGYSQIVIQNGCVDIIDLRLREYIPLEQGLDALGVPDRIHLWWLGAIGHERMVMDFIYVDFYLQISFISIPNARDVLNLEQDFWVSIVDYYSPEASVMPVRRPFIDVDQPALVAYASIYARDVSLSTFEAWLSDEHDMTCIEAWHSLPEEVILPTLAPTLTVAPTQSGCPNPPQTRSPSPVPRSTVHHAPTTVCPPPISSPALPQDRARAEKQRLRLAHQ